MGNEGPNKARGRVGTGNDPDEDGEFCSSGYKFAVGGETAAAEIPTRRTKDGDGFARARVTDSGGFLLAQHETLAIRGESDVATGHSRSNSTAAGVPLLNETTGKCGYEASGDCRMEIDTNYGMYFWSGCYRPNAFSRPDVPQPNFIPVRSRSDRDGVR